LYTLIYKFRFKIYNGLYKIKYKMDTLIEKSYQKVREVDVANNIEYGFGNKIPLWLFGMLY